MKELGSWVDGGEDSVNQELKSTPMMDGWRAMRVILSDDHQ